MSTTPNASNPSDRSDPAEDRAGLDAESARRLLAEADGRSRSLPAAIPAAFITYGMLCVLGTFGVIALHLAGLVPETEDFSPIALVMIPMIVWVFVSMVPLVIFRDRWRRGLGRRWIVLMVVWGALWIAGMLLVSTPAAMVIAPLFLVLFLIAVTGEAAVRRARVADTEVQGR